MKNTSIKIISLLFILCLFFIACEKKEKHGNQSATYGSERLFTHEASDTLYYNEPAERQETELEKFLMGSWRLIKNNNDEPRKNKKGVVSHYLYVDNAYNYITFNKDSKEEPGLTFTESGEGDLIGVKARWTADNNHVNFNRSYYFSPWNPEQTYDYYRIDYDENNWEVEVIDQNKINIIKYVYDEDNKYEFKAQYSRETGIEIKELIDNDNVKDLEKYLNEGNDINERMVHNLTPLMYAIYNGKIKTAHLLIEKGANLGLKCNFGYSALHYAVMRSKIEDDILLNMLKRDLDINIRDEFDQTPLDLTIIEEQTDSNIGLQKLLYENGAVCTKVEWLLEVEGNIGKYLIKTLEGHKNYVNSVAINKKGDRIVSASNDRTIKLWDLSTGKEIRTITGHKDYVNFVQFINDDRRILSASNDKTIKIWDATTGQEVMTFTGHTGSVYSAALSPNGRQIISSSTDKTVKIWNASNGKETASVKINIQFMSSIIFLPDGNQYLSTEDKIIHLFEINTNKEIKTFSGHKSGVYSLYAHPDNKTFISSSGDSTIKLWDISSGKEIKTFTGHTGTIYSVSYSPDLKYIVSGSSDYTARIWDVEQGLELRRFGRRFDQRIRTVGETNNVNSVAFSPDGKTVITGSEDGTIKIWDAVIK